MYKEQYLYYPLCPGEVYEIILWTKKQMSYFTSGYGVHPNYG